jgi:hypothetical protein
METAEISLVSVGSDAVELSSDESFTDSTVTYESGKFHCNDGTDSLIAWTNKHGPPTPKETTNDENEHLCCEKKILHALQVEVVCEVMMDFCVAISSIKDASFGG